MRKSGACILGRRGPGMQASGCQLLQAGGRGCPIEAHVGQAGECAWGRPARTLQAVTGLGLLAHDVQYRVDELRALCVVPLRPVVAGARLRAGHRTRSHAFTECAAAALSVSSSIRQREISFCLCSVSEGISDPPWHSDSLVHASSVLFTAAEPCRAQQGSLVALISGKGQQAARRGLRGQEETDLSKDEIVWTEDLAKGTRADRVHGARLLQSLQELYSGASKATIRVPMIYNHCRDFQRPAGALIMLFMG